MLVQKKWEAVTAPLVEGMALAKCRQCGCMKEALEQVSEAVGQGAERPPEEDLHRQLKDWQEQMEPIRYDCLGCKICYPALALNQLAEAFPEIQRPQGLACTFDVKVGPWPTVPGEYRVAGTDEWCSVAVSTLGSVELVDRLFEARPSRLCIAGKTETENIGIDKIIKNTISNPNIRTLLLAGRDPEGHLPGQTLLSLLKNGVDSNNRVIGSKGKRPIMRNVTREEVEKFRRQIQPIDMIGCEDVQEIVAAMNEIKTEVLASCSCGHCKEEPEVREIPLGVPTIAADQPGSVQMDRAGYFVILPDATRSTIIAEHYGYDDRLLRRVEGRDARSLYWTILENGWVTELSHAAYLGKELEKAELSMKHGFVYLQDGA